MTAKEAWDDKGHGFELGADDYLTTFLKANAEVQALLKNVQVSLWETPWLMEILWLIVNQYR